MEYLLSLLLRFDTWLESVEQAYRNRNMNPNPLPNEQNSTQTPPIVSEVSSTPTENRLAEFFQRIAAYEGANPANNNPTNERYYWGGYLPKYGIVKESPGGFAMFSTLELGIEYDMTCLQEMVLNHPEWDFYDFFAVFAPSKDKNNPVKYAKTISSEMGVAPTTNLKTTLNI
jgi:hypothetical protein